MSEQKLLEVLDCSVSYGPIQALNGVSLSVNQGEIVALLGANGAGKTTLLQTVSGLLRPTSGQVIYQGTDVTGMEAEKIVEKHLIHVPEHRQIFSTMTVLDNLYLGAYHHRKTTNKQAIEENIKKVFELFPILSDRKDQMGGTMSGGQQQMLAIARGMMAEPDLLLLDEPTLGLAPLVAKDVLELVGDLRKQFGTTILLIEQNLHASLKVADRGYVISHGEIIKSGSSSELLNDPEVKEAYLGHTVH
ncbi:branched-chain amino acid ABC transporter ATP-binding protein [Sporosarcina sp. P12(2017)]|uniref:ABC transporter ATP-binding protein n=1 Tax=unclassified Sporosarcina TaxID=2647733 RepID=UPI000C16AF15|nr:MULTISPECIES: ABC transporter ATP-binding protein [unclassified Sporosarcina]PIC57500.1 branched-chain amino acid ABC transporter ATP-binding protein [Sporosarcina sp. P10]PIC60882.1 branched-chain amino acid ABC transporter ATP-binding protein [Sporosarcina sp. P12(2017)]